MQSLHLIVHEEILKEELREDAPTIKRKIHLERILGRIEHIKNTYSPHVKEFVDGLIPNVFPLCEGYDEVILYGCTRKLCLNMIANGLTQRNYRVAFDMDGTTD